MKRLLLLISLLLSVLSGCTATRLGTNPDTVSSSDDEHRSSESNINRPESEAPPKVMERRAIAAPATHPNAQLAAVSAKQPITKSGAKPAEKKVETNEEPQNATASSSAMVVTQNKTKLRKNPSGKAAVIKTLKKGEVVKLIKQKVGWSFVELAGGDTGWCAKGTLAQKN